MEREFVLKCYCNEAMKEAKIEVYDEGDDIVISFKLEELEFTKKAGNYFAALLEVRRELEPRGMKLLCKGCCRNVYPSSMSIDMCGGMVAYTMVMGKEVERGDSVHIFDGCTLEEYATIEEQLLFCEQWYENIKQVRRLNSK
ncbi:MAG: hypothetical protein PUF12_08695 [Thermoflexaceae bacterium]|nr:hypothetical protein [Thermoflexaceae bacterium]